MDLSEYISISGQGGLFKIVAKANNGLIVESLSEKKRIQVYASQKISALQDISIFTKNEDMPLLEVLTRIYEKEEGGAAIDAKSDPADLKKYFSTVLPEYDESRVYVSDMKKVISWYNILQANNVINLIVKEVSEKIEKSEEGAESSNGAEGKPDKENADKTTKSLTKIGKTAPKPKSSTPKTTKAKTKTQTVRKTGA